MIFAEFTHGDKKMLFNISKIKYIKENKDGSAVIWCVNGCCYNIAESYSEVKKSLFKPINTGDENGD